MQSSIFTTFTVNSELPADSVLLKLESSRKGDNEWERGQRVRSDLELLWVSGEVILEIQLTNNNSNFDVNNGQKQPCSVSVDIFL